MDNQIDVDLVTETFSLLSILAPLHSYDSIFTTVLPHFPLVMFNCPITVISSNNMHVHRCGAMDKQPLHKQLC